MPKDLSEFENLEENSGRAGGRKVDWAEIAEAIIESNQFWNAKEVWSLPQFVNKQVGAFRTKGALDALCKKTKKRPALIARSYKENKFWYGPIVKGVKRIE